MPEEMTGFRTVTVSVTITNTGDSKGNYRAVFKIDGEKVAEKQLVLDAGVEHRVSFEVSPTSIGSYQVDINGLTGSFTVKEPAPEIITTAPEPSGITEPATDTSEEPSKPWYLNWWVIGGGVAVLLLVTGFLIYWFGIKRY
ncbi:CARDB domain-containing protein [Chloroflexota bacterium]